MLIWSSEAELLALPMATCCTIAPSHIIASDVCRSTNTFSTAVRAVSCDVLYFSSQNTAEEKRVFIACRNGDVKTLQQLVPHVIGTDIRDYSHSEFTPLHFAAR